MSKLADLGEVAFPNHLYRQLVAHARRKLEGRYEHGEEQAPKAYGLVGGRLVDGRAEVSHVVALQRNLRDQAHLKPVVDKLMDELAVESETPMERRGWVSDPREIQAADELFDRAGSVLLGGYHMHRVPWANDPKRDSCTDLDTELASGSGLLMFILSMVVPGAPVLRTYFEGRNDDEVPIRISTTKDENGGANFS